MAALAYIFISNMADRILLSIAGLLISAYTLQIEVQHDRNPKYRAACDINDWISCTRVLSSRYGRGFGVVAKYFGEDHLFNVRNCNLGIVFYLCHLGVALYFSASTSAPLLLLMAVMGMFVSAYLAYILFFVLHQVCIVCITTYVINGLLMYINYSFYKYVM